MHLAWESNQSLGRVLSDLARKSLHKEVAPSLVRNGVLLLSIQPNSSPVTSQTVAELLEMDE